MPDEIQSFSGLQSIIDAHGQSPRTAVQTMRVRDPETGNVYEMSIWNARDKVRLDGWLLDEPPPEPVALTEGKDKDAPPEVEAAKKPLVELEALRAEYYEVTGKKADGRWGKKALSTKIELAKES